MTKNFQVYFDCGSSKIRAGAFNIQNPNECFYKDSKFFTDYKNLEFNIQEIITYLEKSTNEYLNDVNLMIDSPQMLSIGLSVSNKLDGSNLKSEDIQFLIQQAKQQILKNYKKQNIVHIIIDNYKVNDKEYLFLPNEIKCDLLREGPEPVLQNRIHNKTTEVVKTEGTSNKNNSINDIIDYNEKNQLINITEQLKTNPYSVSIV